MEKFIPFEIAKKLEEKGFEIKPGTNYLYYNGKLVRMNNNWNISPYEYAPTINEVLRWLREEKEIDLVIEQIFIYRENKRREYGVKVFAPQLNKPIECGYFNKWEEAAVE